MVGRLSSRVYKMTAKQRFATKRARDAHGRFMKNSSSAQKRDKYGRFVKVNKLGIAKRRYLPRRDKYGRFIGSSQPTVRRDKRGRFVEAIPVWWRRRIVVTLSLIVLGVSGALYFGLQLNKTIAIEEPVAVNSIPAPEVTPTVNSEAPQALPRSEPTRLRISKIGVDTTFISIGQKTDGTMEVPGRYDVVGWYNKAPTPGELGPSIVVGHVDRPGGIAVFWRLRELLPGDMVEIERADGKTVKFKVDRVAQVPQDSFPTEEVYGNIDHAGIRLITCGGTFNRQTRQYTHNTVVYGSMISESKNSSTN